MAPVKREKREEIYYMVQYQTQDFIRSLKNRYVDLNVDNLEKYINSSYEEFEANMNLLTWFIKTPFDLKKTICYHFDVNLHLLDPEDHNQMERIIRILWSLAQSDLELSDDDINEDDEQ